MNRFTIIIAIALMAIGACDRTRSSTGWDYMPDMYYSNAFESYTPNPNFEDKTDEDRMAAGEALVNPWETTVENLGRGKEAYDIFCLSCHGELGDGQGFLFTSKRYPYPPANLLEDRVKELKDGAMYHSITLGYGIMGAHGNMIRPEDRWKIILHIRENLQK